MKISYILAIIFSIVAILLSVSNGIYSLLFLEESAIYSPDIAVLTATLIAIIWYTAYTFENLLYQKNVKTKEVRSISTALLSELLWLYDILYEYVDNGNLSNSNKPTPLPTPILNSVIKDLSLFENNTVYQITYIYRSLSHFEHKRNKPSGETHSTRTIAGFICIGISKLVPSLIEVGGILPKPILEKSHTLRDVQDKLTSDPLSEFRKMKSK